jgi:hypothetical protein
MSKSTEMFTLRSRTAKPRVSRPLGMEHLERRTVLSATPIVVATLDAGMFRADGPAHLDTFPVFIESTILDRESQRTWNQDILRPTNKVEDASPSASFDIPRAFDGVPVVDKGVGIRRELTRDTKVEYLSNVYVWNTSLVLWRPPVTLRDSSTINSLPEGEAIPPDRSANEISNVFDNDLTQPFRTTYPTPVKEQFPIAVIDDAMFGSNPLGAISDQIPTVSAIDWSFVTWESLATTALDRTFSLKDWSAAVEIQFAEDPLSELTRVDYWSSGTDREISAFTWWREDAVFDILAPLERSLAGLLQDLSEGGLVEFDSSSECSGMWNHKCTGELPRTVEISAENEVSVACELMWWGAGTDLEKQSSIVAPQKTPIKVVYQHDPRTEGFPVPEASDAVDEGGMIESPSEEGMNSNSVHNQVPAETDESKSREQTMSLDGIDVRMDVEVGLYQAFELSTTPHASDSRAGETTAEPGDFLEQPTTHEVGRQ